MDSTLNRFLARGTAAQRAAFTPSPPTPASGPSSGYLWYETDTTALYAWTGSAWQAITTGGGGGTVVNSTCQGRLTTESGVPVSTSDRTAQSTIYFTPYNGNQIALYTGSVWTLSSFSERSLALAGLTSGKNYDVFLYDASGTLTLELSAAWASDIARTDAVTLQDGIVVKASAASRRLVGTLRTTSPTTTEDSATHRFVWNRYQRLARFLRVIDTTNTWTWNSATWHQANASAANQVDYVVGASEDVVEALVLGIANGAAGVAGAVGIGIDTTTANSAVILNEMNQGVNSGNPIGVARYRGYPGLGYHYVAWLEYARAGTMTMQGDANLADEQAGLTVEVRL